MKKGYELENKGAGWKLKCPKCGRWLYLDDDQLSGKVSVFHDEVYCGFHHTTDFRKHIKKSGIKKKNKTLTQ